MREGFSSSPSPTYAPGLRDHFPPSVESVTPVARLVVGLDNNYPGGNGRLPGTPDGTEIITLRSQVPLCTVWVQPCKDVRVGAHNGWSRGEGNKSPLPVTVRPDCRRMPVGIC